MELFELIRKRHSIRKFDPARPVSKEAVQKILEAGLLAPSSKNSQCWRFFVVREDGLRKRLSLEAGHQLFIADAPVVIVVCADLDTIESSSGERGRSTYALQDTAAAIENMLLAITDLGLGSCWIGAFDEAKAAKLLELSSSLRPVAMLPIGVPAETPGARPRKKVEEVATFI